MNLRALTIYCLLLVFAACNNSKSVQKTAEERYADIIKPVTAQIDSLNSLSNNAEHEVKMLLKAQMDSLGDVYQQLTVNFIKENPNDKFSAELLNFRTGISSYEELKELYESLNPEIRIHAEKVAEEIEIIESIMPGKIAPDLTGTNPDGKDISLSDLKDKIVLVDFWATWCGPCRASLPHIKELFTKYHDRGFEVFCIADDDTNPDMWRETITKEEMGKYHNILRGLKPVTDEKGNVVDYDGTNDQSKKYAVHYLPTKYLIGADGTIICKIESDEQLDRLLAEIFK